MGIHIGRDFIVTILYFFYYKKVRVYSQDREFILAILFFFYYRKG